MNTVSFHVFVSPSISLTNVLWISVQIVCPIGLSIPKYIFFCYFKWDALFSFQITHCLQKCHWFLCAILCSTTLLNLFIQIVFWCNLVYKNPKAISSANRNDFNIFLILMLFCLIALVRTFSTMLNRSGDNGHPCFVLDHRRNIFIFYYVNWAFHIWCVEVSSFYTCFQSFDMNCQMLLLQIFLFS